MLQLICYGSHGDVQAGPSSSRQQRWEQYQAEQHWPLLLSAMGGEVEVLRETAFTAGRREALCVSEFGAGQYVTRQWATKALRHQTILGFFQPWAGLVLA